ncbi:MAG: hypothetical protein WCO00_11845 [Rhodospirillaceae bacterium]
MAAMASPARKPPAGTSSDTADILAAIHDLGERMERRFAKVETTVGNLGASVGALETTVGSLGASVSRLETDVAEIRGEQKEHRRDTGRLQQDVAELKGRIPGIEGQLRLIPTLWQLAWLIFAIFGASFVLIRFAGPH